MSGEGGRSAFAAADFLKQSGLFGIVIIDAEGRVLERSGALVEELNEGDVAEDVFPFLFGIEEEVAAAAESGEPYRLPNLNLPGEGGDPRFVSLYALPGHDAGTTTLVLQDTSENSLLHRNSMQQRNDLDLMRRELQKRNEELERQLQISAELVEDAGLRVDGPLIGDSAAVKKLRSEIEALAANREPVLLVGPPGAGREAVARTLHGNSPRRGRAFLYVNCMSLSGDAHDDLFGARRSLLRMGAQRPGKWDLAEGGTIFLDHVDALPEPVGKSLAKKLGEADEASVCVVAYASRNLRELAGLGAFPKDLAELLSGRTLKLPPLAERSADIGALVEHFVRRATARFGKPVDGVSKRTLKRLRSHRWPGDLEELQGVLECAVIASEGGELEIDDALLAGSNRVGSYRLIDKLGEGGMGEVWRAQHELLRRPAAVKLISGQHVEDRELRDAAMKRFEREAQATASLQSPNTVQLFDYGISEGGNFYYVMELLSGMDLDSLVRRFGPMPAERAIFHLRQACRSLGEAHAAGLVHRDIKPANLFACVLGLEYDFLKVLDFGVVKGGATAEDAQTSMVGSPAFMAPELITAEHEVDGRADLYGLACVGYWLLSQRTVFEADTPTDMCVQHATADPRPLSVLSELPVPPALEKLLLECLRKDPADRPADAEELWQRLGEVPVEEPWRAERAEAWWQLNASDQIG